ncbi:MAG: anthranilate synthase component I family protein [Propionibacteriaceae bacterium]|jgi:anthranilate synthase component 1|nr:anthranilate synthase component I family protein [Propionibacteriaceae bacterium]
MLIVPTLAEAAALAPGHGRVPVAATFPAGALTPADCFLKLKRLSRQCFILESREDEDDTGRYSFLGFDPALELACRDGRLTLTAAATRFESETADPAAAIRRVLADNRSPRVAGLPPFTGGLVGYFAYDYLRYAEPTVFLGADDVEGFRDVDLMLFDKVIAFDRLAGTVTVVVNAATDALAENYRRALTEIDRLRAIIETGAPAVPAPLRLTSEWRPLFDRASYAAMVETAQRHIRDGDIFQIVLSNRLEATATGSLFEAYRRMAAANPSPYLFYFSSDDIELAGAAPETLVRLRGDLLETFPLAGTRGRGADAAADAALERELLNDPKELAEHNMLVDLGRNDIGRIARFGTVRVKDYLSIQRFSHVMHIGSTVQGRLRPDADAVDAIAALLPAGTLSGAPKVRACQLIGELEGCRRGVYGGAVGYLSLTGDMDTCIAIRLAFAKNGRVFLRSGAGIVADSVPEAEYEECQRKLAAVKRAVEEASAA